MTPKLPRATVDANMFEQVFMNIALNAAEAMEGNGTLTCYNHPS